MLENGQHTDMHGTPDQGTSVGMKRPFADETVVHGSPRKRQTVRGRERETIFRMLVPSRKAAFIIGRQGARIREIKEMTGAKMKVIEGIPGCDDRVVLIYSDETSEEVNPAQAALIETYKRAYEGEETTPSGQGVTLITRLLVSTSQAGCIIGKGGAHIKHTKDQTGAHLKVLTQDDLPVCALSNDRVVVMSGSFSQLQQALQIVSQQIRDNPPKEKPAAQPPQLQHPLSAAHPSASFTPGPAPPPGAPVQYVTIMPTMSAPSQQYIPQPLQQYPQSSMLAHNTPLPSYGQAQPQQMAILVPQEVFNQLQQHPALAQQSGYVQHSIAPHAHHTQDPISHTPQITHTPTQNVVSQPMYF